MKTVQPRGNDPLPADFPSKSPSQSVEKTFCVFSYLRQILAVSLFFLWGMVFSLFFVIETVLRGGEKDTTANIKTHRLTLAKAFGHYLKLTKNLGLLRLEDEPLQALTQESGILLAANHPGLFDAFIVLAQIPNTACVMRAGLMKHPSMMGAALRSGFISNDVGADFVRTAVSKLRAGENVLIFPEGTRTDPGSVLNVFKGGLALVAIKSHTPIQTLIFEQEGSLLRKGFSLWWPAKVPITIRVRLGERFVAQDGEKAADFSNRIREYFLQELQPNTFSLAASSHEAL